MFALAVVLFRIKFCVSRGAVLNLRHLCRGAIVAFLSFVSRGAVLDVRHLCRGAIVADLSSVGRSAVNFN